MKSNINSFMVILAVCDSMFPKIPCGGRAGDFIRKYGDVTVEDSNNLAPIDTSSYRDTFVQQKRKKTSDAKLARRAQLSRGKR